MNSMQCIQTLDEQYHAARRFYAYIEQQGIEDFRPAFIPIHGSIAEKMQSTFIDVSCELKMMDDLIQNCLNKRLAFVQQLEADLAKESNTNLSTGKILIYCPLATASQGIAHAQSHGFLDDADAPPYPTWLGFSYTDRLVEGSYYSAYLIAWIPHKYIHYVDQAMASNELKRLFWLEDEARLALHDATFLPLNAFLKVRFGGDAGASE